MALLLETQTDYGMKASYWRVVSVKYTRGQGLNANDRCACTLGLFYDPASASNSPITIQDFAFDVTKPDMTGDIVALCYKQVKASSDFFKKAGDA